MGISDNCYLIEDAKRSLNIASKEYRSAIRLAKKKIFEKRSAVFNSILTDNPRSLYRSIRSIKSSGTPSIHSLKVNGREYPKEMVPDGFFSSLVELNSVSFSQDPQYIKSLFLYDQKLWRYLCLAPNFLIFPLMMLRKFSGQ